MLHYLGSIILLFLFARPSFIWLQLQLWNTVGAAAREVVKWLLEQKVFRAGMSLVSRVVVLLEQESKQSHRAMARRRLELCPRVTRLYYFSSRLCDKSIR